MIKSIMCAACLALVSFNVSSAAVFYTDETTFNSDTSGLSLSLEGFETPFTTAPAVSFADFTITTNNVSDLESRASGEAGGHPSTEGSRLIQYYTLAPSDGGGGVTIDFGSPVNAFSIDIIDALDGADIDMFLSLSNDNGDASTLITGSQDNNSVLFAGIYDPLESFSSVTIFSNKLPGDAISLDRARHATVVPIPAAVWLFGSGLVSVIGVARRKKS